MSTHPIKEEVYMVYTEGDPNIAIHEQGMKDRMPINAHIVRRHPDANPFYLMIAREVWQSVINPRIVTNDTSHPNNWNEFQLIKLSQLIEKRVE